MDQATLVSFAIDDGRQFLKLLRNAGIPVKAALWQRDSLWSDTTLVIVTPLVDEIGIKETYRRLDQILSASPDSPRISLLNVSIFTPQSWFYKSLRRDLRGTQNRAVTKRPVGDHIIEDGFIYFVR